MRTLLLNPPWKKEGRLGVRAGSRWPFTSEPEADGLIHYIPFPFFLAYSTSLLKREGKQARLIDSIAEGSDEASLIEKIKAYDPGLILIETSTPSFKNDISLIDSIHRSFGNCRIGLCGPHASIFAQEILTEHGFIDYILTGEYEYTLLELIDSLEKGLTLKSVLGLVYRDDSHIRANSPRPTIDDLDSLPWPERKDVPILNYNDAFCDLPLPNAQVWSSRGCPFGCSFCLWPQTIYKEHRHRKRSPKDVVDEMEYLIKAFGFKAVYFDDDVFNIDRDHVLDICSEIMSRGIEIPWAAMARADLMDRELLEAMQAAGLYAIKYGIESADSRILDLCGKKMDLKKAHSVIKITMELGIKVHLTFCLGLPGETKETLDETRGFIEEIGPDSVQFSFATPFPGTEYFRIMKQNKRLLAQSWEDYDAGQRCIIRTDELSADDLEGARIAFSNCINTK
ncbi:MAG: radical SAM protein [Candidatus Omnitrophica bacterium]|nr:radical SAM protein [Candidatus Omnitrophota bacterium]